MIIYQFPATLNVEFHRINQHGLSDTGRGGVLERKERRRESRQHSRSRDERRVLDARLTEYSVEGTAITGGALDLLATTLNRQTVDLTNFRALKNTFGNRRVN